MIIHPAKHFFQAKFPTIEDHEEEIFYQHPTEDIKCNQVGVLYYDEHRYTAYVTTTGSVVREHQRYNGAKARLVGSKPRVVWECYHNRPLESGVHFLFLNANPLDLTKENLLTVNDIDPEVKKEALKAKKKFIDNTVNHLVKLEKKLEKEGITNQQLHNMLQIPNWLSCARKKYKGPDARLHSKK